MSRVEVCSLQVMDIKYSACSVMLSCSITITVQQLRLSLCAVVLEYQSCNRVRCITGILTADLVAHSVQSATLLIVTNEKTGRFWNLTSRSLTDAQKRVISQQKFYVRQH